MTLYLLIAAAGVFGQLLLCSAIGFRDTFPTFLKVDVFAVILVLLAVMVNALTL